MPDTDGAFDLMYDGLYGHGDSLGPHTITLSGLTEDVTYDVRLYSRPYVVGDPNRTSILTFDEDGVGGNQASITISQDNYDGSYAQYVSYVYTADSSGELVIKLSPNPGLPAYGWFMYGLTNEVVGAVPEPGTLALLATGLIGLLAYAWRKLK